MTQHFLRVLVITCCALTFAACSKSESNRPVNPGGLGPQGTESPDQVKDIGTASSQQKFQPILDLGKRAVTWLNLVNSHRDNDHRLNLADRNTKNPVPPEKPSVTSVDLILQKYNTRVTEIPDAMRPFLIDKKDLVETPPIDDETFLKSIRDINGVYQTAIRWLGEEPYLNDYASNDIYDIRGYYFVQKDIPTNENKLSHFFTATTADQKTMTDWLISMCHNSEILKDKCQAELQTATTDELVFAFYKKYLANAQKAYADFFTVNPIRKDISWSEDKFTITQNFIDPKVAKVSNWLKTNIEEEWQNQGFKLIINFVEQNPISPYLEFVKGVTPHVSGDNWEKITMDPDYSLDDFNTQWTIRHEFGHILGFPDCYLEFYNKNEKTMMYYTIEPDNLMCAWGGKLQPSHEQQLRQAYK